MRGNPLVINAPAELLAKIIRQGRGGQQRVYDDAYPNMPAFDAGMVPDVMGLAIYLKTVLQRAPAKSAAISPVSRKSFDVRATAGSSNRLFPPTSETKGVSQ